MGDQLNEEIRAVLNRHCRDNTSNTPDFILAQFMLGSLAAFEAATKAREDWYGIHHRPGQSWTLAGDVESMAITGTRTVVP